MYADPGIDQIASAVYRHIRNHFADGLGMRDALAIEVDGQQYTMRIYTCRENTRDAEVGLFYGRQFRARASVTVLPSGLEENSFLQDGPDADWAPGERPISVDVRTLLQRIHFQLELRSLDWKIARLRC